MKLQQLKYLSAIVKNDLNISLASQSLFTTQPGVSKQIGLLESELGLKIFERKGKHLNSITPEGKLILNEVEKMLEIESKILEISKTFVNPDNGCLNIYTTNTIARFILPDTVNKFVKRYPQITFHIGSVQPDKNGSLIPKGHSDFSIVAQDVKPESNAIILPAYLWRMSLVVPKNHPLATKSKVTLDDISQYPIISYEAGSTGKLVQEKAFSERGLTPHYFMTVMDVDVILKYVNLNFGVGIVASVAANNIHDDNIVTIDIDELPSCSAWICFSRNIFLQRHTYDFIEHFCPHLTRETMEKIVVMNDLEIKKLAENFVLPEY
ncbi:LysR family transcriptional regulator [Vibrio sp. S17_S38]|uniref:LysR substrate-binding domain-containing protein n=1 Tax=Vibrio sp. S17_S38 TaxID=2720229 RepID=UPI00168138E1|nr:LysR substrate-binding domain-containing protein [Vibrio sp. S17_S38]MBD1571724.1 LysR family transcriptional regulator [Vibrio sp. S17_S38]